MCRVAFDILLVVFWKTLEKMDNKFNEKSFMFWVLAITINNLALMELGRSSLMAGNANNLFLEVVVAAGIGFGFFIVTMVLEDAILGK